MSSETPWQRAIGVIATCTGFAAAAGMVPQAMSVWSGSVAGVSLVTWGILAGNMTAWLLYGIAHRRPAIVAVNVPGVILSLAVVAGVIVNG